MLYFRFEKWTTPKYLKTIQNDFNSQFGANSNAFYSQWVKDNYKTSNYIASDGIRSVNHKPDQRRKNLQAYTFGGMTNIRNTTMYNDLTPNKFKIESDYNQSSEFGMETGGEVLTGFGVSQNHTIKPDLITLERPKKPKVMNFFDQAYGTNVIKRAKERPQSCKSGYSRKSNVIKRLRTYKAPDPYKQSVGDHIRSSKNKNAVEIDERFNENISVTSKQVTESRKSGHSSIRAGKHGITSNALKREIERRKQFDYEVRSNQFEKKVDALSHKEEPTLPKENNEVPEDPEIKEHQGNQNDQQDLLEEVEIDSKASRRTYIHNLQKAIDEERVKRQELEKQIEELKKLNSEISSHLGLKKNENKA